MYDKIRSLFFRGTMAINRPAKRGGSHYFIIGVVIVKGDFSLYAGDNVAGTPAFAQGEFS
jgi:hypothetical protein